MTKRSGLWVATDSQATGARSCLLRCWRCSLIPLCCETFLEAIKSIRASSSSSVRCAAGLRKPRRSSARRPRTCSSSPAGTSCFPAFDAGILKLSASGFTDDRDTDATVSGWIGLLKGLLQDPTTRLLFDDGVGDLVRSLVAEGHVLPHQLTIKHAGEAAVGSGLVARLPALPEAPVDELLDLRQDLGPPLTRYRAAVSRLADKLAFRAFDSEFAAEIDDLWTRDVAP